MEFDTEIKNIKSKDIVIIRFDSNDADEMELLKLSKQLREMINDDVSIVSRFICLQNGIDIESLNEEEFVEIWKARYGEESFEKANKDNPNQLSLFEEGVINE
tara:strand:+ start:1002 stop:1310 length:309 start_codon:yes stop_codon:yes gene_type:complete